MMDQIDNAETSSHANLTLIKSSVHKRFGVNEFVSGKVVTQRTPHGTIRADGMHRFVRTSLPLTPFIVECPCGAHIHTGTAEFTSGVEMGFTKSGAYYCAFPSKTEI
jgi:hypothetical protein